MSHPLPSGRGHPACLALLALALSLALPPCAGDPSPVAGAPPAVPATGGEGAAARPAGKMALPAATALPGPAPQAEGDETPARLAVGAGWRDLYLSGDITEGVAARVAAALAAHPRVERLHLTSDGGLVEEATSLARLVTARRLTTVVADACVSACTLVFVHGRRRLLAVGGRLGFHAPYEVGPDGQMQAVDPSPERAAYTGAGVPLDFVTRAMAVPPADIWVPDPVELRRAGVVTALIDRERGSGHRGEFAQATRGALAPSGRRAHRVLARTGSGKPRRREGAIALR